MNQNIGIEGLNSSDVTPRPRPSPHPSSLKGLTKPYVPDLSEMGSLCEGESGIHASCSQFKQMRRVQEIPPCLCRKNSLLNNGQNVLELFGNALKAIIDSSDEYEENSKIDFPTSIEIPREASRDDISFAAKNRLDALDSFHVSSILSSHSVDNLRNETNEYRLIPKQLCALDENDGDNDETLNDELNENEIYFTSRSNLTSVPPNQLDAKDCLDSISRLPISKIFTGAESEYDQSVENNQSRKLYEDCLSGLENILKPVKKKLNSRKSTDNFKSNGGSSFGLSTRGSQSSKNAFDSSHVNPRIEHKSRYHRIDESYEIKRLAEKYLKHQITHKQAVAAREKSVPHSHSDPASRFLSFDSKQYLKKYNLLQEPSYLSQNEDVNFQDGSTQQYLERHGLAGKKTTISTSKHKRERFFQ